MNRVIISSFLLLAVFFNTAYANPNRSSSFYKYREISLTGHQKTVLTKDKPIKDIYISSDKKSVWILGQKHLWLWKIKNKSLKKYALLGDQQDTNNHTSMEKIVSTKENSIIVLAKNTLFLVKNNSKDILKFNFNGYNGGKTVGHGQANHTFYWLHTDGIKSIDLKTNKIKDLPYRGIFKSNDKAWIEANHEEIWILRNNLVLKKELRPNKVKTHFIHKGLNKFIDLITINNEVYTYTNYSVIRFDTKNETFKAIPVEGNHKLSQAFINSQKHAYLFNDGLLEIYQLQQKVKKQYMINTLKDVKIQKLIVEGPICAIIANDQFKFYLLFQKK